MSVPKLNDTKPTSAAIAKEKISEKSNIGALKFL